MKKPVMLAVVGVVVAVGAFAAYSFAMPHKVAKQKIAGSIYILPKSFTLNLAGGQYATVTVALQLASTQAMAPASTTNPPPDGFGDLPEEAVVRAIITNVLTDQPSSMLVTAAGRAEAEHEILRDITHQTDDKVTSVYFTDLAVQ